MSDDRTKVDNKKLDVAPVAPNPALVSWVHHMARMAVEKDYPELFGNVKPEPKPSISKIKGN